MSGLYNMLFGYDPAVFWIMPMLGRKEEEWPRFRDCHVQERDGEPLIVIYTRVGGGNRGYGFGEERLYEDPLFVYTEDDDFDSTYADYAFKVPEKWRKDFDAIMAKDLSKISEEYKSYLKGFWGDEIADKWFAAAGGEAK